MAGKMPLNRDALDVTLREHNGRSYLTIGEHFKDQSGEWRGGTRSISLDVSDPADREVLECFLALFCDEAGKALDTVKPITVRPSASGIEPRWARYARTPQAADPDRQNGPVTEIPAPSPTPPPAPAPQTPAESAVDRAARQVSGRGRF